MPPGHFFYPIARLTIIEQMEGPCGASPIPRRTGSTGSRKKTSPRREQIGVDLKDQFEERTAVVMTLDAVER
ncbi:hypothetical protein GCM10011611_18040 [Aliidongia dinghuensis]|uniref:Uncharacterized protein n=1 Tax=Aliidongia dinghuensis TaxID=1867774 RepID=A0A8J2YSR1_9PROT|nr:hypothetical protein [Aliidongia dinghuensis]GGF12780.1 hypothetical protein GCM10011611_18040 [Aliidongia dinghuensis]